MKVNNCLINKLYFISPPRFGLPRRAARALAVLLVALSPMPGLADQPAQQPAAPGQTAPANPAANLPRLSLGADATVRLPVGAAGGLAQIVARLENLTKAAVPAGAMPALKDLGTVGSTPELATTVEFDTPVIVDAGETSRAWLWTVRLKNLAPNTSQKRFARFAFGPLEQYLEYVITNQSPAAFTWTVATPAAPWIAWFGLGDSLPSTTVVVTTGDYPASNFRLAQSTLQNTLGTAQIGLEELELSAAPPGSGSQGSLAPRSIQTFFLRLKAKSGQSFTQNGKYTGTLSFAVNERPELQTVNVTLLMSSLWAKLLGALLMALGIWSAWWVAVKARARLLRLEALKPVVALREAIAALLAALNKIQDKLGQALPPDSQQNIRAKLARMDQSLDISELDKANLLPSATPRLDPGSADSTTKLKAFLTIQENYLAGLVVLVQDGMQTIIDQDWRPPCQHQAQILQALQSLDRRVGEVVDRPSAEKVVKEELAVYHSSLGRLLEEAEQEVMSPLSTKDINWEIGRLHTRGWLLWGLLTFLGGLALLIITNPGFGTTLDWIFCFFWGFGLPTSLEKLQQLSPSGIATSIGITQFKAAP